MNFEDFEDALHRRAKDLPYEGRIALGVEICKRLYPLYRSFYDASGFGNPDVLLDSIRFVESGGKDMDVVKEHLDNLEEVCPDAEDHEDAEYALNACGAVSGLLLQVVEPDEPEHFFETGLAYYETIDAQVQDEGDDLTETELDNHPQLVEARKFLLGS